MPVIVDSKEIHPFLPSLGSPLAIERRRAERQDIRPLEIAIINLMADKISTERQLALWLGNTTLQVNLSFIATDSYVRRIQFMAAYREHLTNWVKTVYETTPYDIDDIPWTAR